MVYISFDFVHSLRDTFVVSLTIIYDQGPFGMQLLSNAPSSEELFTHSVTDYIYNTAGYSEANALSLEASIQKSVEEELYSSLEVCSSYVIYKNTFLENVVSVILYLASSLCC